MAIWAVTKPSIAITLPGHVWVLPLKNAANEGKVISVITFVVFHPLEVVLIYFKSAAVSRVACYLRAAGVG